MEDDVRRLLKEIGQRANRITSYRARFQAKTFFDPVGSLVEGETSFLSPSRFISVGLHDGAQYQAVRIGDVVERYLPARKELWRFDNRLMPKVEPLYSSLLDLRNPFPWESDQRVSYEGERAEGDIQIRIFLIQGGQPQDGTLIDAATGRTLTFTSKTLDLSTEVQLDARTCLLRKLVVRKKQGGLIAQSEYSVTDVDTPIDESEFRIGEVDLETKVINFTKIIRFSTDPNRMDNASSNN